MERWILWLILASAAAVVLYLLRQASKREASASERNTVSQPAEVVVPREIAPLPEPKPLASVQLSGEPAKLAVTPLLPLAAEQAPVAVAARRAKKRRRKQPAQAVVVEAPASTPVARVVKMLKQPDALAAAWLLGEIFGPPRSRRRR